jgi:GT2 family glycosyltransferase
MVRQKLSVVIATYNRCNDLEECLDSLLSAEKQPDEVIVVDSSSSDGTDDLVKNYSVRYMTIKEKSRMKARNVGLKHAKGDIVAYLDDDAVVSKVWTSFVLEPYEDMSVSGVGGRVLPYGVDEADLSPLTNPNVGKIFDDGTVLGNFDLLLSNLIEVDTFIGCNMSFRKELLMRIGGFDENFKSNCFREETDICIRLKKAGYKLVYSPKALVWHKWGKNKRGFMDYKWFYWTAYNHAYFYFKNFQPITILKIGRFFYRNFSPPLGYARRMGVEIKVHPLIVPPAFLGVLSGMFNALKFTQKPCYPLSPSLSEPEISYRNKIENFLHK